MYSKDLWELNKRSKSLGVLMKKLPHAFKMELNAMNTGARPVEEICADERYVREEEE